MCNHLPDHLELLYHMQQAHASHHKPPPRASCALQVCITRRERVPPPELQSAATRLRSAVC
ncbi:hypothetical protein BCR44DRAFT_41318 [Catenaria anguillulae PL171]|uniref:Uncharacterized protein n=1 Tax=Catenaria anguillulae PL171 TaxID=765915 RepID=A0A1Y2HQ30_9FUNG|nr:hypothetical protein BCR44DRAFT_41318 [Catenaria anguillulae PL171]